MEFHHQLCVAHGIHLAVIDFLFKSQSFSYRNDLNDVYEEDKLNMELECNEEFAMVIDDQDEAFEITDSFDLAELVDKVRSSIRKFKNSPTRKEEILHKHIPKDEHGVPLELLMDMRTRWSSTFTMLERFDKVHLGLQTALIEIESGIRFTPSEIKKLRTVKKYLKSVSSTLTAICARGTTLMNVDNRMTILLDTLSDGTEIGQALAQRIATRYNERRTVASEAMQFTFNGGKNRIHSSIKRYSEDETRPFLFTLWARINDEFQETDELASCVDEGIDEDAAELNDSEEFERRAAEFDRQQCTAKDITKRHDLTTELDAILTERGAIVERLHKCLLTIPATSVDAERNFSTAGLIVRRINSRLGDVSINALSFLNSIFKAENPTANRQ